MNRLRDLREDKDLYQKDIAKVIKLEKSTYGYYETEVLDISTKVLCELANYYNTSCDYILYNTDERNPHNIVKRENLNRLKEIRKEKKLTQSEVSKILNMSQNGLSQYETSTNDIPTNILIKLSEFYNTSIDYILCRTDNNKKYKSSIMKKGN